MNEHSQEAEVKKSNLYSSNKKHRVLKAATIMKEARGGGNYLTSDNSYLAKHNQSIIKYHYPNNLDI